MSKEDSFQNKELLEMLKRFESIRKEEKIIYLDPEQYEDIVEYYIEKENRNEAYEAVRMGLKIHQDNSLLLAILATLYMDDGRPDKAREIIDRIIDREDCPFYIRLVQVDLLMIEGNEEKAREIIESFAQLTDMDEIDYLEIATLCYEIGLFDLADDWFIKCLQNDNDNYDAILGYCKNSHEIGLYEETIEWYDKLLDKDPYNAMLWTGLAKSYFHCGNMEKTIEATDFAIVSDTQSPETYIYKAHALYQLENFQEAINAYQMAWKIDKQEVEYVSLFISFCYIGLEQWEDAYDYGQKALLYISDDSPFHADAMLNAAQCLYSLKRIDEAQKMLEQIKIQYPYNIAAYLYDARCYFDQGNKEKAIDQLEKAARVVPEIDTFQQIAVVAIDYKEFDFALDSFKRAININSRYGQINEDNLNQVEIDCDWTDILKMKEFLDEIVETSGENPTTFDVDFRIRKAIEEGKAPRILLEYRMALDNLNKEIKNKDQNINNQIDSNSSN